MSLRPLDGKDGELSARRTRTMSLAVVAQLREEIRRGDLEPGTRLRQVEIAERLGVSTTPVREALAALHREGLVSSTAHKGVVVFRPTRDDLRETYEMRIALEELATEKAAPNLTPDDLHALRVILDEMAQLHPEEMQRYPELNTAFHSRIYAAADRPKLSGVIADLRDASMAYLAFLGADQSMVEGGQHEHEAILEACAAPAPRRAASAMRRHLTNRLEGFLDELAANDTLA